MMFETTPVDSHYLDYRLSQTSLYLERNLFPLVFLHSLVQKQDWLSQTLLSQTLRYLEQNLFPLGKKNPVVSKSMTPNFQFHVTISRY